MKKLTTVFGLLSLMLLLTSFTSPVEVGGKNNELVRFNVGGKNNELVRFDVGGKNNTLVRFDVGGKNNELVR